MLITSSIGEADNFSFICTFTPFFRPVQVSLYRSWSQRQAAALRRGQTQMSRHLWSHQWRFPRRSRFTSDQKTHRDPPVVWHPWKWHGAAAQVRLISIPCFYLRPLAYLVKVSAWTKTADPLQQSLAKTQEIHTKLCTEKNESISIFHHMHTQSRTHTHDLIKNPYGSMFFRSQSKLSPSHSHTYTHTQP